MDSTTTNSVEPVTMSEVLELASWNRSRSDDELSAFLTRREAALSGIKE